MQEAKENIERLSKFLNTSVPQEESPSKASREVQDFLENVLQTPPSQRE